MFVNLLKAKIHRATVTGSDLNYEGSIAICPDLIEASGILINEKVEIYNINNGNRFETYVIRGKPGEISLNGAAARLVMPGDKIIICAYCWLSPEEARYHAPRIVLVTENNKMIESKNDSR
ncbi:MAG: aspartate 1-decarboxylase [Bdellovibrionaceae bacterium]|nr:aspartate 1-decarboxylase [Pseudobdellovibrionaceae bacterium]MDW8191136.1 aspartate 1-decarboxylase [Pseudobdellovibrionaceae bacterium]